MPCADCYRRTDDRRLFEDPRRGGETLKILCSNPAEGWREPDYECDDYDPPHEGIGECRGCGREAEVRNRCAECGEPVCEECSYLTCEGEDACELHKCIGED